MLLDLLRTDNYVSFNKKLAHTIGLEASIYVNQIINIMGKAIKKDKVVDGGYIILDRKYIFEQTTLDEEKQLKLEEHLIQLKLLVRDSENHNSVKIDTQLLADITSNDNVKINSDISSIVQKPVKIDKNAKTSIYVESMQRYINTGDIQLDNKIKKWLFVCMDKFGNVNQQLIKMFQQEVYNYSKGNLDIAYKVVDIATAFAYRECRWAIKKYEEGLTSATTNLSALNTSNNISNKTF